jgi:HEAT repeat protein
MRCGKGIGVFVAVLAAGLIVGCAQDSGEPETLQVRPSQTLIDARAVLLRSVDHPNPTVRAYALESTADLLGKDAGGALMQALNDKFFDVRFVAAESIGDIRYAPAKEKLQQMVKPVKGVGEPDLRVLSAVIYALNRLGDESYTPALALLLRYREPLIRASAARMMGKIGHPSAVVPLRGIVKDEQSAIARQTMIEALAVLGETRYQRFLEASKFSDIPTRVSSVRTMGRVGGEDMVLVLEEMAWSQQPPQVRVAAMGELAELNAGSEEGLAYMRRCVRAPRQVLKDAMEGDQEIEPSNVYDLQQMAAEALGKTDSELAVNDLHALLDSTDPAVRVASAASVMELLAVYRPEDAPGLGEQMEQRTKETEKVDQGRDGSAPTKKLHTAGGKD